MCSNIGAYGAYVSVKRNEQAIDDAEVVVNGQVLPRALGEDGAYGASFETPLSAGDAVLLEVTAGGLRVTGLSTLPDAPVLTSPTNGAGIWPAQEVVVTWTSPTDPDEFVVSANWSCGWSCGTGASFEAAGSARTLTIPASSLPSQGEIQLSVYAYDDGMFAGDYSPYLPYPGMNVRAGSNWVYIYAP